MANVNAALFTHRLKVIGGAVVVALVLAVLSAKLSAQLDTAPLWLRPLARALPDAKRAVFLATGAGCFVAFLLRLSGEARLGDAVWRQGETPALVDDGVFSHARNPLYLGTWLFFTSLIALWAPPLVALALALVFFLALRAMVLHEEQLLSQTLGAPYLDYLARVPRWGWRLAGKRSSTSPASFARAVLPNLGLLSFALFRIGVALTTNARVERLLGLLNIACVLVWLVAVLVKRARALRP